jgi:hypothetical protein
MKKILAIFMVGALTLGTKVKADEGMWLLNLISQLNYADMQAKGLKLTPEQLYSINNASLKDAIVSLGGFCTGEIISGEGLMLTNHHCGFDAIRTHSSVENDYLTDGFWAMNRAEEKSNDGLYVRILLRMEDVTDKVMAEMTDEMSETERAAAAKKIGAALAEEATKGTKNKGLVKNFFHGNEYYLFIYEQFDDVRLVGAPPSSVGKYGGDTDNWMWPRHTGDFSMFRIYTAPDGSAAPYAEDNVPLSPRHHLPVSVDGVKDGDFTMVFGFPGSTDRYLSSHGVQQAIDKYNPTTVDIRDLKLATMRTYMEADDATRILLASNYAQTANYWKYYIGQTEQLKNNHVYDKKKAIEDEFSEWANADASRKATYGETLDLLAKGYSATDPTVVSGRYLFEAGIIGPQSTVYAWRMDRIMNMYFETKNGIKAAQKEAETAEEKEKIASEAATKMERLLGAAQAQTEEHFGEYHQATDVALIANLWGMYAKNTSAEQQPAFFADVITKKYKGDFTAFANGLVEKSIFVDKARMMEFLAEPNEKAFRKEELNVASAEMLGMYFASEEANAEAAQNLDKGYRLLTAGLREMNPNKKYAPDANSTIRMTYGTVGSYYPKDGVFYDYYTTIEGIMQKEDANNDEFVVPAKLKELYMNKDYGQYANADGQLPVCFISNNDITGGNSGSPVINGNGELIGCAFDGNWEAMSGDIFFETKLQRTISVDIRYVLFIIDKYAGAGHLVDEMTLVKTADLKTENAPEMQPEEASK